MRLLDRPEIVVLPVLGREEAAAAQAGNGKAVRFDRSFCFFQTDCSDLVTPGRDTPDAVPRAAVDDLGEVPLLANRRGVERKRPHSIPGGKRRGRKRTSCGHMITRASTPNIGSSMMNTSLSAS